MIYRTFRVLFLLCAYLVISTIFLASVVYAESVIANDEYLAPNQQSANRAQEVIDDILSGDEFSKTTTREIWQFKNSEDNDNEIDGFNIAQDIIRVISVLFKFLVIVALIVLLVLLIYYREQWLGLLKRKKHPKDNFNAPDILFGMDIRPESLPDDIPASARQLWEMGKHREALSLLYRGALMYLVQYAHLPLDQSHTEGDVLTMSRQSLKKATNQTNNNANYNKASEHNNYMVTHTYLKKLTQAWQTIAYAHRLPNEQLIDHLLLNWQTEFQQPLHDYQKNIKNPTVDHKNNKAEQNT